jgi:CHASE1-domain containing sensor protein
MLGYLKQNKKKVTHVVTADLSRLTRRIEDQASLLAALRKPAASEDCPSERQSFRCYRPAQN